MIVFPLKIPANTGKYFLQVVKDGLCKDAMAIFRDKDQNTRARRAVVAPAWKQESPDFGRGRMSNNSGE